MLEFLRELSKVIFVRRLKDRLPDCKALLFVVKANVKLEPQSAARYVALCRVTGVAVLVRYVSVGVFLTAIILVFRQAGRTAIAVSSALTIASVVMFGMLARLSSFLASGLKRDGEGSNAS